MQSGKNHLDATKKSKRLLFICFRGTDNSCWLTSVTCDCTFHPFSKCKGQIWTERAKISDPIIHHHSLQINRQMYRQRLVFLTSCYFADRPVRTAGPQILRRHLDLSEKRQTVFTPPPCALNWSLASSSFHYQVCLPGPSDVCTCLTPLPPVSSSISLSFTRQSLSLCQSSGFVWTIPFKSKWKYSSSYHLYSISLCMAK